MPRSPPSSPTSRGSRPASRRGSCPSPATTRACCGSTSTTGIAFGTDGVGTKMVVAEQLGRFETIGIDCIAMNVNDLVCVGAEPIALVDFILCPTADPELCGAIGEGLRRGAELSGIEIPGGEIAQVGDVVNGLELAGSAIGDRRSRRDRHRRIDRARRRGHRPPLLRPALERLHARPPRPRRHPARRRPPRPPARRDPARADRDLRPPDPRAARLRRRRARSRPHHRRRAQQPAPARQRGSATTSTSRCPPSRSSG